jgi:signal transduction histidine kinase
MGSTLSTINILSSMAKTKIGTDPAKSSEYISKISENSQRMMEAMDDIVWSIKPQNDTMEKLIARMRELANHVLESKDILFTMEVDERVEGMKLSMDARRDLFLIFKEGINNAAKYSRATRLFISFSLDNNLFVLKIKDYGVGFDPQEMHDGNGLENMRKRAANLNGTLSIQSKPGEGTELILKISL